MLLPFFLGEEPGGRPGDLQAYRSDGVVDYLARRKRPFSRALAELSKNLPSAIWR